jgi:hypothetical protein
MSQQNGDIPDQNRCSRVRVRLCSEIRSGANLNLTFYTPDEGSNTSGGLHGLALWKGHHSVHQPSSCNG